MVDIKFIVAFGETSSSSPKSYRDRLVKSCSCNEEQNPLCRVDRFACVQFFTRARFDRCKSDRFEEWVPFLLEPRVSTPNSNGLALFDPGPTSVRFQSISRRDAVRISSSFCLFRSFRDKSPAQETRGALIERLANRFVRSLQAPFQRRSRGLAFLF